MNQITFVLLLLWTSGTNPASTVDLHSPEDVTAVHNGITGRFCGVPAIKPVVPGCPTDGLGIVNGTEAVPHSWPWQVSLQTYWGWHFCGGSLINKDWVVTAAHCDVSRSHRVILGQHNLKKTYNIQSMRIGQVIKHPNYNSETIDYDIALIKLQSPAQMNKYVSPVCVAETSDIFSAGMKCVATGWGRIRYENPYKPADKLQQACMPLLSYRNCMSYWGDHITSRMFCAGASGAGTCQGDSGGPLVCKKHGAWTLVGITSFGQKGCPTNKPRVDTAVSKLRTWMDRTMANN